MLSPLRPNGSLAMMPWTSITAILFRDRFCSIVASSRKRCALRPAFPLRATPLRRCEKLLIKLTHSITARTMATIIQTRPRRGGRGGGREEAINGGGLTGTMGGGGRWPDSTSFSMFAKLYQRTTTGKREHRFHCQIQNYAGHRRIFACYGRNPSRHVYENVSSNRHPQFCRRRACLFGQNHARRSHAGLRRRRSSTRQHPSGNHRLGLSRQRTAAPDFGSRLPVAHRMDGEEIQH